MTEQWSDISHHQGESQTMDYSKLPCPRRQKIKTTDKTGQQGQIERCAASNCSHFCEVVTPEICAACPLRTALIVAEEKKKPVKVVVPKPDPEDRIHRVIVDTASSHWVLCGDRKKLTIIKPCGRVEYVRRCDSSQCDHFGNVVSAQICSTCALRRDP